MRYIRKASELLIGANPRFCAIQLKIGGIDSEQQYPANYLDEQSVSHADMALPLSPTLM